jgi:hypothetical protein
VANRADCNTTAPDLDGCDTATNTTTNCGGCGVACDTITSAGVSCNGATCQYSGCAAGYADCNTTPPNANGCETIITNNAANCGGCGQACDTTNSTGATCSNSQCHYTGCSSGFSDCASAAPDLNGCETSLSSTASCSGCGLACDAINSVGASCNGTTCSYASCAPGYKNCNKTAPDTNGCETRVNTTTNCGDCGVTCGTLNAGTIGCSGAACTYTCNAGYSNCNTTGSNTTGCECHSTGCCVSGSPSSTGAPGATCETVHNNGPSSVGLGQSWDDCVAPSTFNTTQALAACIAKFGAAGGCMGGWTCGSGASKVGQPMVCNSSPTCSTCWAYGTQGGTYPATAGTVTDCACPGNYIGTWN